MIKRVISVILIFCILATFAVGFTGCSGDYPLNKGAKAEETIHTNKKYTVGDAAKTGWELQVPKKTFDKEVQLTMTVLSKEEAKAYENSAFEFVGTPVKITAGDKDSVRLNQPVTVTMQIPKDMRLSAEKADDYMVGYYTGKNWVYIFPEYKAVGDGYITFETFHFSMFSAVKLTDEEKVKLYTQKMAVQTWDDETRTKTLSEKLQGMFNESFEKMGISDTTIQGKLFRSIAKESDFGTLIVSAEQGEVTDFGVKCSEMAANALIKHYKLEEALMENISEKGAAVATGLVKGAQQVAEGNYTDAAKELSSAFIGYFPAGRAYQAAIEVIDTSIATWKDYELDAAYKSYVGAAESGQAGYKVKADDWSTLEAQMRGYLNRLQSEAKDRYCAVNGISRSELDKDTKLSRRIENETSSTLKKMFERRLASEQAIQKKQTEYEKIIKGFEKSGLLTRGSFGFVGMDVQDRLRTLFSVRQNILDMFGGKMPLLKSGESAEDNLNEAIGKWLSLGPKKRGEFYKWLEEKGYKSKIKLSGGGFAWVLQTTVNYDGKEHVDATNKGGVYEASSSSAPGSYSYTWKYLGEGDTYYDPDLLAGENSTSQCTWTVPPSTIQAGQTVTLSMNLSFGSQKLSYYGDRASAGADFDKWDVEPGYVTGGSVSFKNKDGKDGFTIDYGKKVLSVSETLSAVAPAGSKAGDKIALRTTFSGVKQGTCYIYEWKAAG